MKTCLRAIALLVFATSSLALANSLQSPGYRVGRAVATRKAVGVVHTAQGQVQAAKVDSAKTHEKVATLNLNDGF